MAGKSAAAWALLVGAALGGSGGWLAGRHSVAPPPPPPLPVFRNPFAEVSVGESLVLRSRDGALVEYRVLEVQDRVVRLSVETRPKIGSATRYEIVASRNFYGFLMVLEHGDPERQEETLTTQVDTVVDSITAENVVVLGKVHPGWRVEARHSFQGPVTFRITDALPVHGLVSATTAKGGGWDVDSWSRGEGAPAGGGVPGTPK